MHLVEKVKNKTFHIPFHRKSKTWGMKSKCLQSKEGPQRYHWNHVDTIRSEQSLSSLPHSIQRDSSINTTTVCISV